jgi:hypothetical protein
MLKRTAKDIHGTEREPAWCYAFDHRKTECRAANCLWYDTCKNAIPEEHTAEVCHPAEYQSEKLIRCLDGEETADNGMSPYERLVGRRLRSKRER